MCGILHFRTQETKKHAIVSSMENELLNIMLDEGIISSESLRQVMLMQLEKKVALVHEYAIYKLPDGRWKTYLPFPEKRKEIRSRSKEELLKRILEFYKMDCPNLDNRTLNKVFDEWIEYKSTITDSLNTILRHKQHYRKYFEHTEFFNQDVSAVDFLSLQAFCNSIVKENNLSGKEWKNIKTILKGMFEYSFHKGYIKDNPLLMVKITVRFRQVNRKTGKSETFNENECKALFTYLDGLYEETNDTALLGLKLNFYLGLRIGELSCLKWIDFENGFVHIVREEIYDKVNHKTIVVSHTKTGSDRFVPIPKDALPIVNELEKMKSGEYVFMRGVERVRTTQFSYILRKYSRVTKNKMKSSHKIRKTYASKLDAAKVPIDEIRILLGHTQLSTTLQYLYNPLSDAETVKLVDSALSSNK